MLPAGGFAQVAPVWRFAHPNAKSLIGLDVRRIRQSGLGRFLDPNYLEAIAGHIPGMDLLSQVDTVVISSPGSPDDDDSKEPPILIVARGRFDLDRARRILRDQGTKAQTFDSVTVYRPQGKASKEFGLALIDAGTILAGDAQSVFSAIERRGLPAGDSASPAILRAQTLSEGNDVWAVMSQPGAFADKLLPLAQLGVTRLELGMSLRGGLILHGSLSTRSEPKTRALREELNELLKAAARAQPFAKKLKLAVEASDLRFSLRMSQNDLEASVRNVLEKPRSNQSVVAESKPVITAKPQVIRIEGLDEGSREVKYLPDKL